MGSIHRVGLVIAGLATVLTIAAAFVVAGYTSARQAAAATPVVADAVTSTATPDPTASPTLDPQIIYIAPVPSPAVIHVPAPAAQVAPQTPAGPQPTPPVIHVVVPAPGGGDDGGGGDD